MNSQAAEQVRKNMIFLTSILKCIEFSGRQGIALRGHLDDNMVQDDINKGNFFVLLQLRVDSGDLLKEHLDTCKKNTSYISKTSQNELLDCIKTYIQSPIVQEIAKQPAGPHYGIMADEVTNVSNWEQLGVLVWYLKDSEPVERLLFFAKCEKITGAALCDEIIAGLKELCRSQCFDGAGNMAGVQNGCAANCTQSALLSLCQPCMI